MFKTLKLIILTLSFSVFFSIHAQEENSSASTYIQLVKNKKKKHHPKPKYELAMCCITRDEAEYLPEWIDFHLKQGVEHIFIYDNLTTTNLQFVLREYLQKYLVQIIPWPYEHHDDPSWATVQLSAYKHFLDRYGKETEWCAFIDTDEFLFCPDGKNLRQLLKGYKDYQALMVCWIMYGTSNIWEAPQGKLIQTLFYRAPEDFHLAMKPIVKTRDVKSVPSMHYFEMRDISKTIDENYTPLSSVEGGYCPKKQSVNKIRINHYAFRDGKFFEEVKIPRYLKRGISEKDAMGFEALMNVVYDDCISKCAQ